MNETIQNPLNLKEAAEWLKVSPSYIYYLVHYGKLPAYKPGAVLSGCVDTGRNAYKDWLSDNCHIPAKKQIIRFLFLPRLLII
jgi:excisionase family DNA binding protein